MRDTTVGTWQRLLREAAAHRDAARAAEEQLIRDAHAAGLLQREIIAAYGRSSRARVSRVLNAAPASAGAAWAPCTVYLRGQSCGDAVIDRVERAMAARGWSTVRSASVAWHRARSGVRVVALDFSATYAGGYSNDRVTVSLVRARYDGADLELVPLAGGSHPRPTCIDPHACGGAGATVLDVDALARLVAVALAPRAARAA